MVAAYRGLYLHGLERSTIGSALLDARAHASTHAHTRARARVRNRSDQAAQCLMLRHPEHSHELLMAEWGAL